VPYTQKLNVGSSRAPTSVVDRPAGFYLTAKIGLAGLVRRAGFLQEVAREYV
jgi:hypothetical protein